MTGYEFLWLSTVFSPPEYPTDQEEFLDALNKLG